MPAVDRRTKVLLRHKKQHGKRCSDLREVLKAIVNPSPQQSGQMVPETAASEKPTPTPDGSLQH